MTLAPRHQRLSPTLARTASTSFEINPFDLAMQVDHVLGKEEHTIIYRGLLRDLGSSDDKRRSCSFTPVAIKMARSPLKNKVRQTVVNEIEVLKLLHHNSHIISLLGYMNTATDLMLVTELCQLGPLSRIIQSHPTHYANPTSRCPSVQCFSVDELLSICWQVGDALSHMAERDVVHRDVCCENVYLTERLVCKVGGFKRCMWRQRPVDPDQRVPMQRMAVESVRNGEFTEKSDVFQFGSFLFEVFSGGLSPFEHLSKAQLLARFEANQRTQIVFTEQN